MKTKNYLYLFLLSALLCLALTPLGGYGGFHLKLVAASLVYFALTFFFLNKTVTPKQVLYVVLVVAFPPFALYLPIHSSHYQDSLLSLPASIAHFVGVAFGYLAYKAKGKVRYGLTAFMLALSLWAAFFGYSLWAHQVNFGTFSGNVRYQLPTSLSGQLLNQQSLKQEDLKGKVILLDFWHTRCGVCFTKFPAVQKLYDTYKTYPSFALYAVNTPLKEDTTRQAFAMLTQRNYSFPVLLPKDGHLAKAFGVSVYPTTVVIDQSGVVVYKGDIEKAAAVIDRLLENSR